MYPNKIKLKKNKFHGLSTWQYFYTMQYISSIRIFVVVVVWKWIRDCVAILCHCCYCFVSFLLCEYLSNHIIYRLLKWIQLTNKGMTHERNNAPNSNRHIYKRNIVLTYEWKKKYRALNSFSFQWLTGHIYMYIKCKTSWKRNRFSPKKKSDNSYMKTRKSVRMFFFPINSELFT